MKTKFNLLKHKKKLQIGIFVTLIFSSILSLTCFYNQKQNIQHVTSSEHELETEQVSNNTDIPPHVTDETAPKVSFKKRYLFTNDIEKPAFTDIIASVSEHAEWSAKLIRFEKLENLKTIDENTLNAFQENIIIQLSK